jgi:hypothetical protein
MIYLPPTMSPSETSSKDGFLEYPTEALDYYRRAGVESVVCEKKHMGPRAAVVAYRDEAAAVKRFGVRRRAAHVAAKPFELARAGAAGCPDRRAARIRAQWLFLGYHLAAQVLAPWPAPRRGRS